MKGGPGQSLQTDTGEQFPQIDGILCLLREDERGTDPGDKKFYDENPFGERDWKSKADVEAGVEQSLKSLVRTLPATALIADVGSGPGRISNYLSLAGYSNVISLDYSLASLRQVKTNSQNVCIWGNNLHLPLASDAFDLVISSGVIHHTPDPHKCFEECVRILKPGGRLYLRVYNRWSLYGFLYPSYGAMLRLFSSNRFTRVLSDLFGLKIYKMVRRFVFRLPPREDRILRAKFGNLFLKQMVYFFSSSEVAQLFQRHGLIVEGSRKIGFTHRMLCYVAKKQLRA